MKLYRTYGTLIVETEHETVKETVEYCVENNISLYGADLSGADLSGADLSGADLSGTNLYGSDIRDAYLHGADIHGAKGIFTFNKQGGRTCYAVQHETCLMIKAGCFWGSLDEFEESCKKRYEAPIEAYAPQIAYLRELEKSLYTI